MRRLGPLVFVAVWAAVATVLYVREGNAVGAWVYGGCTVLAVWLIIERVRR